MFVGFVFPSTSLLMSLDRKVGFGLGLGSKKLVFWVFGYLNPSLKVNRTDFALSDHCEALCNLGCGHFRQCKSRQAFLGPKGSS